MIRIVYTCSSMVFSLPSSASSSSSSSSSTSRWSHHVFLSFRGIDTRNTFTAHLYDALCRRGINTYIDEKDLERGESISPKLLKVIEESMISIIVLSPNYASSTWCLEELTKILECKETKKQIVLPVFYHVDPSEIRNQKGRFGEALTRHQERFKENTKVQRWKTTLQEVANLAGEHLENGNESEFIHKIIQWVDSKIVTFTFLNIAEYPVGLESSVKELKTLLGIGRNDITLMIGIYGIGGIGKTTIAKAVYNSIAYQFEARCFLENVREISSREDGLVKLQDKLHSELFGDSRSFNVGSVGGINVIKHSLCSKRILLILDDVNELLHLKELAGDHNWFGPGSRIIITTRDQHLLTYHKVDSMYEVSGLDDNQAIQLFSWHAFKRDNPLESYVELTKCIIGYAKGLPLALIVLGSYLHDRSIQEWKSALEKYERNINKQIYEILKISYDGLDDNEKDIFLDIACFFKGKHVKYVLEILDHCGFSSTIGITRLKEKCLINIGRSYQNVEMHDLLQEMGKEIVRQESPKKVGKRSRLWFHEDVRYVLEENMGTNKIEGILLDFPGGHDMICLHSEAFMKMKKLRLFINHNAQFFAGPTHLSNELRVLDWSKYPSSFLPSNFHGNKLTIFGMPYSLIKELGDLKPKNLTDMDLSHCKFLTKIPDLSSSPNLKQLNLQCCENLVEVHHSIGFLDKLSVLLVNGCCKLRIFPKRFKLRSLYLLEVYDCSSLEDFPEIECEMEFLYGICLEGTGIKELPVSIENLTELKQLDLDDTGIKELPSSIGNLTKLEVLSLNDTCIKELPSSIGNLSELEKLYLNGTVIKELPSSFGNLAKLEALYLNGSSIEELPSSFGNLTQLRYLYARGCKNLVHLPSTIDRLQNLRFFQLDGGSQPINIGKIEEDGKQSPPSVVSTGEYEIASSAELTPTNSSLFNDGSSSSTNGALLVLSLQFCCLSESNFFTDANYFPNLVELDLTGSDIVIFPQSDRFAVLRHLCLNNCKQLEKILQLPLSIEKVEARGCTSLESFAQLSEILFKNNGRDFNFLKIDLYGCHKLLVNMRITSWEERHPKEQNWAYPFKARSMGIIFPGKRIPSWFRYSKEAHDSNSCEIDINRTHYSDDIDEIVFCVVIGFRFGINLEMEKTAVCVRIHDGWHWNMLFIQYIIFDWTDSDHLWMAFCPLTYRKASRFRFECDSELVVFRSVGVHLVKKHEENARDHAGLLHEDDGAHFEASNE
ncbi:hypothetical protein F2P56_019566 [Juglans regia]|uniref:TIR domain-containing protein n=2 Tax=Juglans regia TaxID=51240 RepID=A0A833UUN3_JUGRE|nr:disease resistance protein RUN1-like isoform X1 [Juglans regia]KAF5459630.1 hypothetical protein F2P56_019566 [Juglans regia]